MTGAETVIESGPHKIRASVHNLREGVQLWLTDNAALQTAVAGVSVASFLSDDEQQRLNRLTSKKGQQQFVLGRFFLRTVLALQLAIQPKDIEFFYSNTGKPFVRSELSLVFNLSHSEDRFALVTSQNGEVGVDIERCKSGRRFSDLVDMIGTEAERNEYEFIEQDNQMSWFYRLWTLKEATVKAHGIEVIIPFCTFALDESLYPVIWNPLLGDLSEWQWWFFRVDAYRCSVAVRLSL